MPVTEKQVRYMFSRYNFCISSIPLLQDEIENLTEELKLLEAVEAPSLKSPNMDGMPRSGNVSDPTAANAFGSRDANYVRKVLLEKRGEMAGYLGSVTTVRQWLVRMNKEQRAVVEAHLVKGLTVSKTIQYVKAKTGKGYGPSGIYKILRQALDEIIERNT